MTHLRIVKYGDVILNKKTLPVDHIGKEIHKLIKDMFYTMYEAPGIGLAANQVGVPLHVCVIDTMPNGKSSPIVLINSHITEKHEKTFEEEGCLSLPGIFTKVRRWKTVTVAGISEKGLPVDIRGEGLLAKAFQHELDHLAGKLIIDSLHFIQRLKVKRRIRRLKKDGLWDERVL